MRDVTNGRAVLAVVCALALAQTRAQAIAINTYINSRHDRFYSGADKAFIVPVNMSAVGQTYPWSGGEWLTMIDDQYFLTAGHAPAAGFTVTLFEGNDANGPRHAFQLTWAAVGTWGDLRLGRLTAPIPTSANIVPMAMWDGIVPRGQLNPLSTGGLYTVGRGFNAPTVTPLTGHAVAKNYGTVGANNLLGLIPGSNTIDLSNPDIPPNPDGGTTVGGDSGGPSFVIINGQPRVAGIHYVVNGDSYVPASRSAVLSAIATDRAAFNAMTSYSHTKTIPSDVPGNFRSSLKYAFFEAEYDVTIRTRPADSGRTYSRTGRSTYVHYQNTLQGYGSTPSGTWLQNDSAAIYSADWLHDPGVKLPESDGSGETYSMRSMKHGDTSFDPNATHNNDPISFYWNRVLTTTEFPAGWYFVYTFAAQEPGRGANQNYRFHIGTDSTVDTIAPSLDTTITTSATPSWYNLGLVYIPDGINSYRLSTADDSVAPYFDTLMFVQLSFQVVPEPTGVAGWAGAVGVLLGRRRR